MMTKAELSQHLADFNASRGRRFNRTDVAALLSELQRLCLQQMVETGEFSVPGIVRLVTEHRAPRRVRDPTTGRPMTIPARQVVRARISRHVRGTAELERPEPASPDQGENSQPLRGKHLKRPR